MLPDVGLVVCVNLNGISVYSVPEETAINLTQPVSMSLAHQSAGL